MEKDEMISEEMEQSSKADWSPGGTAESPAGLWEDKAEITNQDSITEESEAAIEAEPKASKKKVKTDKKQEKLKEQIEELEDRVKRQMAEFDNFRKRTEKEKSTMFEVGAKSVIDKILPVVDNFERGLLTVPELGQEASFAEGMGMIYKQMMTALEELGVKPIEAVGAEFDPDYHNAVMQVDSEEYEAGTIAQELQKGYMYRDCVVRHSMVAVAK